MPAVKLLTPFRSRSTSHSPARTIARPKTACKEGALMCLNNKSSPSRIMGSESESNNNPMGISIPASPKIGGKM